MITEAENQKVNESVKIYTHKSGLKIYVCEKKDYSSSYAIFGTRYGSIDTKFKTSKNSEFITVPEGIAHYLEHKLFESEEGDAFTRFSKTGAMANAFTSFDRTCYLFSCSTKFDENFRILLDFVQHPYFTEETVRKEQGIIGQEISMYDDNAPWKVLFNLLGALYENHPVKIDIAGTVESIAKINAKLLYDCYNTFYNLNNMFICVAGNVKAEDVFKICDELIADKEPVEIERFMPCETEQTVEKKVIANLPVSIPLFAIGYKESCEQPHKTVMERVASQIILKSMFGSDSNLYKELYDSELINDNFGTEHFYGFGYSSVIVEGESNNPDKVFEVINRHIENKKKTGFEKSEFERAKKAIYGSLISSFNSVENTVMNMVDSAFLDNGVFDELNCIQSITLSEVNKHFANVLNTKNAAISIIKSKGEQKND